MTQEFDLTILTPCQTGGEKLVRTIRSINSAVMAGLRIQHIILHNLSSLLNMNEYQSDYRWRQIDVAPDNGPYDALNRGLSLAKGRFVQVLNAGDVIICSETLEKACQQTAAIVSCAALDEFGNAIPSMNRLEKMSLDSLGRHEATLIQREVILNTPFDLALEIKADRNQLLSIIAQGHTVQCTEKPLVMVEADGFSSARVLVKEVENLSVSLRYARRFSIKLGAFFLFLARVSFLTALKFLGLRRETGRRMVAAMRCLSTYRQRPGRYFPIQD